MKKILSLLISILVISSSVALGVSAAGVVESGNANGDSEVNVIDLVRLKKYLTDYSVVIDFAGADADGDGFITSADLVSLRKILLNSLETYNKPIDLPDVDLEF